MHPKQKNKINLLKSETPNIRNIDNEYFTNYVTSNKPYHKVFHQYSYYDECIRFFKRKNFPGIKSICVLGTASGEILEKFHKGLGIKPHGCEINKFAYNLIASNFKKNIELMDMRKYIPLLVARKTRFDLVFSNSFQYLPMADIPSLFESLSNIGRFIHFHGSFWGHSCPDRYRKTLKSYSWWNERFKDAGFSQYPGVAKRPGKRSYLWLSK